MEHRVRPDLHRKNTILLNGEWEFGISDKREEFFDSIITVPYSPEAKRSNINRTLLPSEMAFYRKMVPLKKKEGKRYRLTFLAVDYYARVFINGVEAMKHEGGYLPFSLDITQYIKEDGFEIKLYVKDPSDSEAIERGKQSLNPHRIWYPSQSGIWGDVYLEEVDEEYIEKIIVTPDFDNSLFNILIVSNKRKGGDAEIEIDGKTFNISADKENIIKIETPHPWSPDDPYIYYFKLRYKDDEVESYTALRKFSLITDKDNNKRLALNNKVIFHHGILDQGYIKDGLMTLREDEIVKDLEMLKGMGFNMIRKHIKIESPAWYFHATRLGFIVWQDMVSGGARYNDLFVTLPLFLGINLKDDRKSKILSRRNEDEKKKYESFIKESILYLYSVPCIGMWCIFNEGWGQFDSSRFLEEVRKIDSTRTIDITSGWHDQGCGDFYSRHVYFRSYKFKKDKKGRAVILSEFGGIGMGDETTDAKKFTYKETSSPQALMAEIRKFYERDVIQNIKKGLSASVYTQLSDVEQETNGLVSYDRKTIKVPIEEMAKLSREILEQ